MSALKLPGDPALVIHGAEPIQGWVSGSGLTAAMSCAASAVLPRIRGSAMSATKIGSALHEHIRERNRYGVSSAVEMLPALAVRFDLDTAETELFVARARAFEWSPPRGAIAELPLCLFEDGRVEVVKGGKGVYELGPDALIPTQIDLFWAEPTPLYREADGRLRCPPGSVLWVVDFKSGKEDYVPPAERNAQALAAAVNAAKFTGATKVLPGIVYIRKGQGIWDVPDTYLDEAGIERVRAVLEESVHAVRREREAFALGRPLTYREGMHCNLCRARHGCPAHLATLKAWLGDPDPLAPGALKPAQIKRLAELAPAFRRFAASVDAALRAHVEETGHGIDLSDGRRFGPHPKTVKSYEPVATLAILEGEVGEHAKGVGAPKITRASIERAVEASHKAQGISKKKAEAVRRIHGKLAEAGAIREATRVEWGVYKPRPELAPTAERMAQLAELNGLPIDGDLPEDDE